MPRGKRLFILIGLSLYLTLAFGIQTLLAARESVAADSLPASEEAGPWESTAPFEKTGLLAHPGESAAEILLRAHKMFIDSWELPNGGIAIIRWEETYSDVFYASQCYFISNDTKQQVFTYTSPFSPKRLNFRKNRIMRIASGLRARDEWETFPEEEGFCFYGGFLASPDRGEWEGSERAGIVAEFSEYPAITMAFSLWANGVNGPKLLDEYDLAYTASLLAKGGNILRRRPVPLGPLKAEEFLLIGKGEKEGKKLYNFMLRVPSERHRRDRPEVWLTFTSLDYMYDRREPFASEAQALGLWDAVSRSIRLRVPADK